MRRFSAILILALVAVVTCAVFMPGVAIAATKYVKVGGAGNKDGSSWANAMDAAALVALLNGHAEGSAVEIWVAAGTYSPGGGAEDTFNLKKGVKLYGGFAGTETALAGRNWKTNVTKLDGGGIQRIVAVVSSNYFESHLENHLPTPTPTDTRLDGFTITGGNNTAEYPDAGGGGMTNIESSPTIANCTFSGNAGPKLDGAGGLYNLWCSPMIVNCAFANNTAGQGGGMTNLEASPTVSDCTFSGNVVDSEFWNEFGTMIFGGGMLNFYYSSPIITNCTFSNNTASQGGGAGMFNHTFSSPIITDCTFSKNKVGGAGGGGMTNFVVSNPEITNCTFSGNISSGLAPWGDLIGTGGGMHNTNSSPKITNCDFSDNEVPSVGGGIGGGIFNVVFFLDLPPSSPTIINSTFKNNTARSGSGMYSTDGSSSTMVNCTFSGNDGIVLSGGGNDLGGYPLLTIINCTFSGNPDGAIINHVGSSFVIANTIFWGNTTNGAKEISNYGGTITLDNCVVIPDKIEDPGFGGSVTLSNIVSSDPKLVGVGGNVKLQSDSPAIGAGLAVNTTVGNAKVPAFDQRNTPRPNPSKGSQKVDIGAYEYYIDVPVTGVTLNKNSMELPVGTTETLTATVQPTTAIYKAVKWSSSDPGVVTVNSSGLVTAITEGGSATITVTTMDGGHTATCAITVPAAVVVSVTGVTVSPTSATISADAPQQLTATVAPLSATNRTVKWSSSNPSVVTVSSNGLVTVTTDRSSNTGKSVPVPSAIATSPYKAVKRSSSNPSVATSAEETTVTITATTDDGGHTATCAITVIGVVAPPIPPIPPDPDPVPKSGGGGGCNAGYLSPILLLVLPIIFRKKK